MSFRYVNFIEAEIAAAADSIAADCARGKLAGYHVRQGREDLAKEILSALRARYSDRPLAAISAWVNLVEGLVGVFKGDALAATDKIRRAHVLSSAGGLRPMRALAAGWLANLSFGVLDVPAMHGFLREALEYSTDADHEARARACLVAAVALDFANRYDLAKPWYRLAHRHAAEESRCSDGECTDAQHGLHGRRQHASIHIDRSFLA